jgi:hypothetical protein
MGFEGKGAQWFNDEAVRAEKAIHRVQAEPSRQTCLLCGLALTPPVPTDAISSSPLA